MVKGMIAASLGLAALFAASPSHADYVVYTNRTSFEAALKTESTENFNELGSGSQSYGAAGLSHSNGLTSSLTIAGSSNYLTSGSASSLAGYYPGNSTYLIGPISSSSADGITVSLPAGTYSGAGADVANFASNSLVSFVATTALGVQLNGSVSVNASSTSATFGFLGVVSTDPGDSIATLKFSSPPGLSQNIAIDNVSFGTAAAPAVPEPGSMALLLAGSLAIGAGALRRRLGRSA